MKKATALPIGDGPLAAKELAELTAFLDTNSPAHGTLTIEYVDGLFAGLMVMPEATGPSAWLPFVLGQDDGPDTFAFASPAQASRIISLLMRHWNAVSHGLRGGGAYKLPTRESPIAEEGPPGRAWARSFFAAGEMAGGRAWRKLIDDPSDSTLAAPFMMLATNGEPARKGGKPKYLSASELRQCIEIVERVLPLLPEAIGRHAGKVRSGGGAKSRKGRPAR